MYIKNIKELNAILKIGNKIQMYDKKHSRYKIIHIRAIVDDVMFVCRYFYKRKWYYEIQPLDGLEVLWEVNVLKYVGKSKQK